MRKALAVALAVAVQAAGLSAPFVHAHPDEHDTSHHSGGAVHVHWDGHAQSHQSSDSPALDTADHDRAVLLDAFVAVSVPAFPAPTVTPAVRELPRPAERSAPAPIEIVSGHDPPFFLSVPPRAPPSLLS